MTDLVKPEAHSPYIRTGDNTRQIMLDVIIALMPALTISIFIFGWRSLSLIVLSALGCVVFELLSCILMRRAPSVGDFSAVVTGILLAFCMPVSSPIWLVLLGDAFAIVITKMLFGGIGCNFLNPALAAHAFLLASFLPQMTFFTRVRTILPLFGAVDALPAVTPLSVLIGAVPAIPVESLADMAMGMTSGLLGETSSLALVAGGLYLLYRRVISWRIPAVFLGTVAALTFMYPQAGEPLEFMTYQLLSGSLILGAIFMATDYTTSPVTKTGQLIYGAGCGALTVLLRYYGSMPDGVPYAILMMNVCVFLIDRLTRPRRFGQANKRKFSRAGDKK